MSSKPYKEKISSCFILYCHSHEKNLSHSMKDGYTLLILLFAISALLLGLLIAIPVWQTQIQREKEENLIFSGKQYVEAIRLYQKKYPGKFPNSLDELIEEKCLRRLYKDPVSKSGEWDIILLYPGISARRGIAPQKIYVVPSSTLSLIQNPQIIGVVSSSPKKSIKIYNGQESHDKWLFFYGHDPSRMPEIVYYGQEKED